MSISLNMDVLLYSETTSIKSISSTNTWIKFKGEYATGRINILNDFKTKTELVKPEKHQISATNPSDVVNHSYSRAKDERGFNKKP